MDRERNSAAIAILDRAIDVAKFQPNRKRQLLKLRYVHTIVDAMLTEQTDNLLTI